MIVGNKEDLADEKRAVFLQDVKDHMEEKYAESKYDISTLDTGSPQKIFLKFPFMIFGFSLPISSHMQT